MGVRKYEFDSAFELLLAYACAVRPNLMGVVGRYLDPDRFVRDDAAMVLRAGQEVMRESGRGPTAPTIVSQRMRRWVAEGKITKEAADAGCGVLVEMQDVKLPAEQEIAAEVAPVLRRDAQGEAVRAAVDEFQKHGDFGRVTKMLLEANRIGVIDSSAGTRLGPASFDAIRAMRARQRLPTGVLELDAVLGGGPPVGTLSAWVAAYGGGKSMGLTHVAAHALKLGLFVAEITVELPEGTQLARLKANLTGVPIDQILEGDEATCAARLDELAPLLGTYIIKDLPAKATTVLDVWDWVGACEAQEERRVDVLIVDYADKLGTHKRDDRSEYAAQGTVWEELRLGAKARSIWCWTASQAKANNNVKQKGRRLEGDDMADSINKARIADLIVSLNPSPDNDQFSYFIAKNRHGKSGVMVGPLPHDLFCARIAPVT